MKMNKILVSALAIAMGATLAGSISGTVAWYQYSTRAQASYVGTSVGKAENLQIKTKADGAKWKDELSSDEVKAGITSGFSASNLEPVTTGDQFVFADGVGALPASNKFYLNPTRGIGGYGSGKWEQAEAKTYMFQFQLDVRYKKTYNKNAAPAEATTEYVAKKLHLVDLTIRNLNGSPTATDGTLDLFKAIRVHIGVGSTGYLFARDQIAAGSSNSLVSTAMGGKLDMGNNGVYDQTEGYDWDSRSDVVYGDNTKSQVAINAAQTDFEQEICTLGTTEDGTTLTITIWIEGWQQLGSVPANNEDIDGDATPAADNDKSAMWDPATYINKAFQVGMRFEARDA